MKQQIRTLPGGKWVRKLMPGQTWMMALPGDWVGHLTHYGRIPGQTEEQLHIWKSAIRRRGWCAVSSAFGYDLRAMGVGRTMAEAVNNLDEQIRARIKEVLNHGQA